MGFCGDYLTTRLKSQRAQCFNAFLIGEENLFFYPKLCVRSSANLCALCGKSSAILQQILLNFKTPAMLSG
jgi:hypothetical protein